MRILKDIANTQDDEEVTLWLKFADLIGWAVIIIFLLALLYINIFGLPEGLWQGKGLP